MRPHLDDGYPRDSDSGRIIYLGDVRRRKAGRGRRLPDRHYAAALVVVTVVSWAIWLTIVLTVPPSKLLTYLAFLSPLSVGLASSGALIAYALEYKTRAIPNIVRSLRRGLLFSAVAIVNVATLAAHHWSVVLLLVSSTLAIAVDLIWTWRSA
ncbi:MAG: hypothetical protein PVSMB7_12680 [Chloroflexota bacterium]